MIKPQVVVDFLVPCVVIKSRTQDDCYVVNVISTDSVALLPREYAQKQYKVGDTLWGIIHEINGWKVTVIQKGKKYVNAILKGLFALHKTITVHDVAHVAGTNFYKVAVKHSVFTTPDEVIYDCIKQTRDYIKYHITDTVTFVPYDPDPERFIINALRPGKEEHINKITLWPEGIAEVYVEPSVKGVFLGPKGLNVATAAKLTGLQIQIK